MKFRIGKSEFSGLDSKTAMYAALGASLAGARVLLTTDDAGFVPAASRVTGRRCGRKAGACGAFRESRRGLRDL